jgi:hypothetical protein
MLKKYEDFICMRPTTGVSYECLFFTLSRSLDNEAMERVLTVRSLSMIPKDTILEISSIEMVASEGGDYGIATFQATYPDKSRHVGRVRLSAGVMERAWFVTPCLCLYQGMKTSKGGRSYHDVATIKVTQGVENMKKVADGFRQMAKSAVTSVFTVRSLDSFPENTVFVFKNVSKRKLKRDAEESITVEYETEVDGVAQEGTVLVPSRLEEKLMTKVSGLMVFCGQKTSSTGKVYNDLRLLDEQDLDFL